MTSKTETPQTSHAHPTAPGGVPAPDGFRADTLPDIRRAGVGTVLISEWDAGTPERQQAMAEGAALALRAAPLPDGLVSQVYLTGTDGRTVLGFGQWADGEDGRAGASRAVVEAGGARRYRYYRSLLPEGEQPEPGCVVAVSFGTTGHEAARQLVDGLLDLLGEMQPGSAETSRTGSGGISSNFHISEDGTRVFNYSEWTDEAAHQRTVETSLQQGGAVMNLIASIPGVTPLGFKRYVTPRGLVRT
ncbi:antibiotic biosynthesis monooxygenase [Streptomyces chrestomyceticus JCM 4735]|uniref:Antibiotic biosynthesis monooxygenase n=1 Tax=Streptomyces chrestomyceticus JCM 4735 TaxID=1306181 RepID=A0A7U9KWN7_9ACTN|nr:antibiotic biosynthesis monooxygenase [Streptomyces chrestomyceticus]GCD36780.1 antibiotic biosynthesis monooxygenase [Streptomyces chrestomyceticus JCM 4735]